MFKKIAASFLIVSSISAMEVPVNSIQSSYRLGDIQVIHDDEGFWVNDTRVHESDMDRELRSIGHNQLAKLVAGGAYIRVSQSENDNLEYSLQLQQRIRGGGPWGCWAGVVAGKAATYAVFHGAIWGVSAVVSTVATPATGVYVGAVLENTFAIPIEVASHTVSLGCGIIGAAYIPV